jgi:hypothetical protein
MTQVPYFSAWTSMLANLEDVGAHYYQELAGGPATKAA